MSLLQNLKVADDAQGEQDTLGTGGVWDSDIYLCKITMAYLRKSKGGALGLNLHLENEQGRELKQELWVASGDKKGNLTYSVDSDGNKKNLPGFNNGNALCLLTLGKELQEVETEDKIVKLYDFDAGKEVPTEVPVLTDLLGEKVYVAVEKQVVDKNVKNAAGDYVASGETREVNEIDKFFRADDKRTTVEILGEADAEFFDNWLAKKKGTVRNRATGSAPAGKAGAPATGAAAPASGGKSSLFGKKAS